MRISDRYERFTDRVNTTKAGATTSSDQAVGKATPVTAPARAAPQSPAPAARTPHSSLLSVKVSDRAAQLSAGSARLEELRESVRNGTFKVDAHAIAQSLVGEDI